VPAPATFTPTAERLLDALGPLDAEPEANDYALQHFVSALAVGWDTVAEIIRDRDDGRPGFAVLFDPDDCPADFLTWASQFVGVVMLPGLSEEQQRLRIKETGGAKRGTPSAIEGAARQFLKPAVAPFNYFTNPSGEGAAKFTDAPGFTVTREAGGANGVPAYVGSYRDKHQANTGSPADSDAGFVAAYTFPAAGDWVVSLYVWVPNEWTGTPIQIVHDGTYAGATTGVTVVTDPALRGRWQRIWTQLNIAPGDLTGALLLRTTGATPTSTATGIIYTDAMMVSAGTIPPDYSDGDTEGHHWVGTPHASVTATDGAPADASVYVIERHGSPYELTVATLTAETPQADLVLRALQEQRPAGLKLTHVVVDGGIYTVLLGAHANYAELVTDFANYDAVRTNPAHT
jgi:hypothetical protein